MMLSMMIYILAFTSMMPPCHSLIDSLVCNLMGGVFKCTENITTTKKKNKKKDKRCNECYVSLFLHEIKHQTYSVLSLSKIVCL